MEPFISRDGTWLFFNNRNKPKDQTDIHIAKRIDETHFRYIGQLGGANSKALDGVPSMDRAGMFFFISPRAYDQSKNTLWQGQFTKGRVENKRQITGDAPRYEALWLNIDAEISANGQTLYFVENRWRLFGGGIKSANILLARKNEQGEFIRPKNLIEIFKNINTDLLEFAPATSADERTLYFTRVDTDALRNGREDGFGIFVATRPTASAPFGPPQRIKAIKGYVEGPTVSPDGCAIYFHKRVGDMFKIQMSRKRGCRPQ